MDGEFRFAMQVDFSMVTGVGNQGYRYCCFIFFFKQKTAFDIAEANLNAAQHQVDQARAAVQSARDNLRKTTLIAPMTGRVTRLAVGEGEVAVPRTASKVNGLLLTGPDLSVIQADSEVDD